MANGVWQNTIRDSSGRIALPAQVTVLDTVNQTPRDLFSDRDGENPIDNPVNADADGLARFYTAVGRVDLQIVAGGRTALLKDVVIIDDFPG